jgi:hypothetical protein
MRALLIILGIVLAAAGGVIAYRAAFVASPAAVVVTSTGSVHEVQNVWKIVAGLALLVAGALLAFFAARRRA